MTNDKNKPDIDLESLKGKNENKGVNFKLGFMTPMTMLTIAMLVLKATGYLNFSWWIVFAPVLIPTAALLFILIVGVIVFLVSK